jgi:hypothetical protein
LMARLGVDTPQAALAKLSDKQDAAPDDDCLDDDSDQDEQYDDAEAWADESTK